jgi:hypothetical protein
LSLLLQHGGADVDAATDRYGNRPSDEAQRYNFDRGIELLCGRGKPTKNLSANMLPHPDSSSNIPAARLADARVTLDPQVTKDEPHFANASHHSHLAHADVNVAISESTPLIAAALEDMRSQGSKARFLLPSLLCSAVSSGAVLIYLQVPVYSLTSAEGNTQEIRNIYEHYGSMDISDYDLRTPLHVAVSLGKIDMVTFLLSLNVPASPVDRWGATPLWSALCEGKKEISQVLRSRGGEIKQSSQAVTFNRDKSSMAHLNSYFFQGGFFFVLACQQPFHCPAASSSS